jgi:hypothetical protein
MKSRPIAAAFFVVFCLLLCGLILRRQIAAHPLPPDTGQQGGGQGFGGKELDFQDWRPAAPSIAAQVHAVVQAELAALRTGDAPTAMSLQSRFLHQRFSDPSDFLRFILFRHPELVRSRTVNYGLVWTDPAGQNARAALLVEGRNGERTSENFLLIRESGRFKISRIRTQTLPN